MQLLTRAYRIGGVVALTLTGLAAVAGPASAARTGAGAVLPGAPRSVTATAGDARITVGWAAPSSDGGSAIISYTASCTAGAATKSVKVGGSVLHATVTGLTNGTAASCTVVATNGVGSGPHSAPSPRVTPVGPPAAPTGVLVSTRTDTLIVKWGVPATGGSPITGYSVACTSTDGGGALGASAAASAKTVSITGLPSDTTYSCTVSATNAKGTSPAARSADYAEHDAFTTTVTKAVLHLPVTAGQRATLVASADAVNSDACTDEQIDAPDGTQLTDGCLYKSEIAYVSTSTAFRTTGVATGVLTPPTAAIGSAEVAGYAYTDVKVAITADGPPVLVQITAPGQLASASFTGKANQVVSVTANQTTLNGNFDIRTASGDEIAYAGLFSAQQSLIDQTTLPAAGSYTIGVSPGSYGTGATTLRLYDVPANTGTITVGGASDTVTISTPGENATRTFSGSADAHLTLDFSGNTIQGELSIRPVGDDTELGYVYLESGGKTGSFTATLPSAGTYRVFVDPSYDHLGEVTVKLHT